MNWLQAIQGLNLPPLQAGSHDDPERGLCAMEMVAFIERLPHSDHPECTCPVIAAFVRGINDTLPDDKRQRLIPYLPRLVGTVDPWMERARAEYLAMQAVTVFAPIALDAAGMHDHAERMRSCKTLAEGAAADVAAVAAARAADFAMAADAADVAAARAASAAGYADAHDQMFTTLDGLLAIGEGKGFTSLDRLPELEALA